jgi:hypothetical protein
MTMRGGSSWFSPSSRVSARRSPVMSASDSQSDSDSSNVAGAIAGRSHETESGGASPNISEARAEAWCKCDSYQWLGFVTGFFVYMYLYCLFRCRYEYIWQVTIWGPQELFLPYLHQFLTILDDPGLDLDAKHRTIPVPVAGTGFLRCFAFKSSPGSSKMVKNWWRYGKNNS